MTSTTGPLARLDRSRDELAKAWLMRLIERASLDEIRELPTDRIAQELPELIGGLVRAVATNGVFDLSEEDVERAAILGTFRSGPDSSPADVVRDVAALQSVVLAALRDELAATDPEAFAEAVERLVEAVAAVEAAALEELVRTRSQELEAQANTDPLTGLYNLRYLHRELGQLLDLQKRYEHPFAILLLDVDGLKRINDSGGHLTGDRVLVQLAASLRRSIRSVDIPARMGGDEFCVLAPEQDAKAAAIIARRLAAAVHEDLTATDAPMVGVSIGVAACPAHGDEAEALIDAADRAMYRAKASGESVAVGESSAALAEEAKT
jgi:diguanylate cyclase (GGDEF)-like protein